MTVAEKMTGQEMVSEQDRCEALGRPPGRRSLPDDGGPAERSPPLDVRADGAGALSTAPPPSCHGVPDHDRSGEAKR